MPTVKISVSFAFYRLTSYLEAANKHYNCFPQLVGFPQSPVLPVNSDARGTLHLPTVFANDFTNHFFPDIVDTLKKEKAGSSCIR